MSKPIAVIISDVHYSLPTLEVADAAMRQAIAKANELKVHLIVAGDLHDTKANLRAECITAMRNTFEKAPKETYVMVGNHDKINEKSEANALSFLEDLVNIVVEPLYLRLNEFNKVIYLIPYYSNTENLKILLKRFSANSTLIMHQGIHGSNSGEYLQDKTAITKEDVAGFRVISGHYHQRQTIKLPQGGKWDYIGNPYTLNFGEANDLEKGFQILMDDGSLEFIPTNLRQYIVVNIDVKTLKYDGKTLKYMNGVTKSIEDLAWVKLSGSKEELSTITKAYVKQVLFLKQDFRLELIPTDESSTAVKDLGLSNETLLDSIIDNSANYTAECKERLKATWKTLIS